MGTVTKNVLSQQLAKLKVEITVSIEENVKKLTDRVSEDIEKFNRSRRYW